MKSAPARVIGNLTDIEIIMLQLARARLVLSGPQENALATFVALRLQIALNGLSESPCDGSTRIIVRLNSPDLGNPQLAVEIDTDGGVALA